MTFKKIIFLLAFSIPLLGFTAHKYYLSLTEITFSEKQQSIQIIMNVFMDDIELVLNKKNNIDLRLTTKQELTNNDIYFKNYLEETFFIKIDDSEKKINYLGKEYEGDLVYFYLEILEVENFNAIEVTNKVLIDQFSKQQNLIKLKKGNKHKSVLLTQEKYKSLLKF